MRQFATASAHARVIQMAVLATAAVLLALATYSIPVALTVLLDGAVAVVVLGSAVGWGLAVAPWILPQAQPLRLQLLCGAVLGIGGLSTAVLVAGLVGFLPQSGWTILVGCGWAVGLAQIRRIRAKSRNPAEQSTHAAAGGNESNSNKTDPRAISPRDPTRPMNAAQDLFSARPGNARWHWLFILLLPFVGLALASASHAPGLLWQEEGFAYDVLEYHLQLPREYFDEGRISYRPHNIYGSFPANVEMLYLLCMVLTGDPWSGAIPSHFVHAGLAIFAVIGAWVIGRERSSLAAAVCAVSAGTCGWLVYFSGLAYVENGVLFFAIASAACAQQISKQTNGSRWAILAGLAGGFATGCKYTSAALVALPIAISILAKPAATWRRRTSHAALFSLGWLIAFSPWAIKNTVHTGNPVFPLANDVFGATPPGWSAEQDTQWTRGHRPPARFDLRAAATDLKNNLLLDPRMSCTVWLLPLLVITPRRFRENIDAWLMLWVTLGVWLFCTHRYARFASVAIVPLLELTARASVATRGRMAAAIVALVVAGSAWNTWQTARMYFREAAPGVGPAAFVEGHVPGLEWLGWINVQSQADSRILLIAEARPFYMKRPVVYATVFNRTPVQRFVLGEISMTQLKDWFAQQRFTAILANWSEAARLRRTYGFPDEQPMQQAIAAALTESRTGKIMNMESPTPLGRLATPAEKASMYLYEIGY